MPGAEVVIGMVAGAASVGSFVLGSGPEAVGRLTNINGGKTDSGIKLAEENAEFVLATLQEYGKVITKKEHTAMTTAYWRYQVQRQSIESSQDAPPQKDDYFVKIIRLKTFRKLSKETRIRNAVEKMLKDTTKAKGYAVTVSAKIRFKEALEEGKNKPPTPLKDRNSTASRGTDTYPPGYFEVPDDETASIISRVFQTDIDDNAGNPVSRVSRVLRTNPKPDSPRPDSVPGRVASVVVDEASDVDREVDLGEPLARYETNETVVGASLVPKE